MANETTPAVTITIAKYLVADAALQGHRDYRHFAISVQLRGHGQWVVHHQGEYLDKDGRWTLEEHRFDEETAKRLAVEAAPHVVVNGKTIGDVLAASE